MNKLLPSECFILELDFIRDIMYDYCKPLSFYRMKQQYGGSTTEAIHKFTDKGKTYRFNVSTEIHDDAIKIIVLSKSEQECITVIIYKDSNDAILHNMSYYPDCAQLDNQANEGLKRPGGGSILLRFIYKYLVALKNKYKINKIVLKDNSYLYCDNCTYNISLARLKMLTEGRTWYSKYGFKPYNPKIQQPDTELLKRYNQNKKIITKLKTSELNILNMAKYVNRKEEANYDLRELDKLTKEYRLLGAFIKKLSMNFQKYCCLIYYVLKEVYESKVGKPVLLNDMYGKTFYLNI